MWVCIEGERMAGENSPRSGPLPFTKSLQVLHQVSVLTSGSFYPALFGGLLLSDDPFLSSSPLSQAILQLRDPPRLPLASRRKPTSLVPPALLSVAHWPGCFFLTECPPLLAQLERGGAFRAPCPTSCLWGPGGSRVLAPEGMS